MPRTHPVPRRLLLLRALRRHCPQCGSNGYFDSWFKLNERCPRCGLATERVVGHFVGAVGFNTIFTFGVLLAVLLATTGLTYPNVQAVPLVAACLATAVVVPTLFWPYSQTLWTAFDLAMRPATESELDPRHTSTL